MKRAVIMSRVSSEEQAKGFSLDVQFEQLTKYCQRNAIEIVEHYKEDHSAKNFNRPEFQKFLKYIKKNKHAVDYLLVTTWDRFSRNVTDSFVMIRDLKKLGIEVQAIEQPIDFSIPESKAMLAINLVFPEIDNDRRSIKIRGGIRGSLKAGRWCRLAPMGYQNKRDDQNKPIIVPNNKARFIQYAYNEIEAGKTQVAIREALQLKGFKVSRNNLSLILKNPLYIGKIVVPAQDDEIEKWVEGIHQGIIRESQFYKVQKLLNQRKLSTKRPSSNTLREELPLRGKLQCSKCTGKMTGSPSRSGNGNQYFYYHCNHCKKERYAAKKVNSVFESILEDFVFTKQSQVLYKEILKAALGADQGNIARKKLKIEKELSQLSNRIDKLQDLLVDGAIDPQSYGKTLSRYTSSQEMFEMELDGLKVSNTDEKQLIDSAFHQLKDFQKTYKNSEIHHKKELISSIFPEYLEFDGEKCRTSRINDVLRFILQIDKDLPENKTGQISNKLSLSRLVETPRIELGSKQAAKKLSTYIVLS